MTIAIGSAVLGLGEGWLAAIMPGSGAVAALGWTLLHFCWQGAAVALVLWCALGLLPARWTRARYGAACLALALMAALPVGTFARLAAEVRLVAPEAPLLRMEAVAAPEASGPPLEQPLRERIAQALDAAAPWVPAIWLVGVVLFLGRLKLGLAAARRMRVAGTQAAPRELQSLLRQLASRLQVERAVQLMHTAVVQVPTVIGWLRPVILLPIGCFSGLSQTQMEALLAHELAHIRRHDYLVSVFQSVVEALLFYHPAVWWVSRQMRQERECCCDELAVGIGGDRLAYARALSFLEERRAGSPELLLGANGGVLTMRIRRLLGYRDGSMGSRVAASIVLSLAVVLAGSYVVAVARAELKSGQTASVATTPEGVVGGAVSSKSLQQADAKLQQLDAELRNLDTKLKTLEFTKQMAAAGSAGTPEFDKALEDARKAIDALNTPGYGKKVEELALSGGIGMQADFLGPQQTPLAGGSSAEQKGPYATWLNEDVLWIITDAERAAFLRLPNDEERDRFIAQFWARRDAPGGGGTLFKEEHYARIAYANQHFAAATVPGWKSDRGHIYIAYGKPESIDAHPSGGQYQRPNGGGTAGEGAREAFPFEVWHYRAIPGIGENVDLEFVDSCRCGEYRYTIDRMEKDLLKERPGAASLQTLQIDRAMLAGGSGLEPDATQAQDTARPDPLKRRLSDQERLKQGNDNRQELHGAAKIRLDKEVVWTITDSERQPASRENQGGTAAQAEANKEYAETEIVPKRIGGGVSAPLLIYQVDPEAFSDEARKQKITGTVVVSLWVDEQGNPTHVKLLRGLGSGGPAAVTIGWGPDGLPFLKYVKSATQEMNDKAIEAVKLYRFKPAMENGKPVLVELNVEVNYQLTP